MLVHTVRNEWQIHRNAIATVDSPSTGGNTIDAPDDPTERKAIYMVDTDEAAIISIDVNKNAGMNFLELRAHFNDNAGTATGAVFAARYGEKTVRMIAELAWTAGTAQTDDSTARYYAKTTTVTQYWNKTISKSNDEATFGMSTMEFDTRGYEKFWVLIDALSGSDDVSVEFSG